MSVQTMIPTLWSARLTTQLAAQNIWLGLTNRNFEGEIQAAGDTVRIGTLTTDVTIGDYVVNTDIADPQSLTTTTQDLLIDQQKYFNIFVDDVDRAQAKPALMEGALQKASIALNKVIDPFIGKLFYNASTVADRTVTVGSSTAKLAVSTATNRSDAAKRIIEGLTEVKEKMFNGNIPVGTNASVVMSPHVYQLIEGYLIQGTSIDYGGTTGNVLRAGLQGTLAGFQVYVSANIPTASDKHQMVVSTPQAVTFASQIVNVEGYRPQKRFGDAVKGLYVYGAKLVEAQFLFHYTVYVD